MSLLDDINNHFDSQSDDKIVQDALKFKAKLGIGERAFASLRLHANLGKFSDFYLGGSAGAAIASSSIVAKLFVGGGAWGWLTGLFVAPTTPLHWVIMAGLLGGGGYMGVMRLFKKHKQQNTIVIPKFINSPLDVVAIELLGRMVPLAIHVANADGNIDERELEYIRTYFCDEWGFGVYTVDRYMTEARETLSVADPYNEISELGSFCKKSRDCDVDAIVEELNRFLTEISLADGEVSASETEAISKLMTRLNGGQVKRPSLLERFRKRF